MVACIRICIYAYLDLFETPSKQSTFLKENYVATPLTLIDPNKVYNRSASVNPTILDSINECDDSTFGSETRASSKRKVGANDSQEELESSFDNSLTQKEKSAIENTTNNCKKIKSNLTSFNMLQTNQRINFAIRTKGDNNLNRISSWKDDNGQMQTNEEHMPIANTNGNANGGIGSTRQTLNDFPTANETSALVSNVNMSTNHKPRVITRDQYSKKKENTPKPKTILILLTQDQLKFAHSGANLGAYVMDKTKARLEISSGAVDGYTLINHKLFLYPGTNDDHDKIFTNKSWSLGRNQMFSLENKGNCLILRGISVEEIETHDHIKDELSRIGIKSWKPLVGEDPKHMGVKVECHTRGNLIDIMHKHFVDGRSYSLNNGKTAYMRIDPDIKNPMQCFKCLALPSSKSPGHFADKCPKEQLCGNCGQRAHVDDPNDCERRPSCVNCPSNERNNHSSFDRKCPTFMAQKEELIRQEVYNITRKLYNRLPSSRKEQYAEIVKKNAEASQVAQDMGKIKEMAESQMGSLERRFGEKVSSWDRYFNELKLCAASTAEGMRLTLEETRATCGRITELVDKAIEVKLEETKAKVYRLESKAIEWDDDLSRIDENLVAMSEGLHQMQDGQCALNDNVQKRLGNIEQFLSSMKSNVVANNGVLVWEPTVGATA
jgi:hypothetical protein